MMMMQGTLERESERPRPQGYTGKGVPREFYERREREKEAAEQWEEDDDSADDEQAERGIRGGSVRAERTRRAQREAEDKRRREAAAAGRGGPHRPTRLKFAAENTKKCATSWEASRCFVMLLPAASFSSVARDPSPLSSPSRLFLAVSSSPSPHPHPHPPPPCNNPPSPLPRQRDLS